MHTHSGLGRTAAPRFGVDSFNFPIAESVHLELDPNTGLPVLVEGAPPSGYVAILHSASGEVVWVPEAQAVQSGATRVEYVEVPVETGPNPLIVVALGAVAIGALFVLNR